MGGSGEAAGQLRPARPDARIWECEHSAGGVHRGLAGGERRLTPVTVGRKIRIGCFLLERAGDSLRTV